MKKIMVTILLLGGTFGAAHWAAAQTTNLCSGSGEHCMDVEYGILKAHFVKAKGKPGVVIIDDVK